MALMWASHSGTKDWIRTTTESTLPSNTRRRVIQIVMQLNKNTIVKTVAVLTAATGLFRIVSGWRAYLALPAMLSEICAMLGPLLTTLGLLMMLIPMVKLVASFGLFLLKPWGWFLAIALLTIDFAVGLQAGIRMHYLSGDNFFILVPRQPNAVTNTISLWPTYVISLLSIMSVVALLAKPSRELFVQQEETA